MKGLKLAGLGVAIWGLGLLWPEVNLLLTPPMMIRLVLGLGVVVLVAYVFDQYPGQRLSHKRGAGQGHPPQPIPPTPAALVQ